MVLKGMVWSLRYDPTQHRVIIALSHSNPLDYSFFLTQWYTKTTVNIDTINATNVLIYLHITAKLLDRLIIIFPIIAFNIAILILHTNACCGSGSNSYFDPDALHKQPIYLDLGLDPAPMAMELGSEIRSVKRFITRKNYRDQYKFIRSRCLFSVRPFLDYSRHFISLRESRIGTKMKPTILNVSSL